MLWNVNCAVGFTAYSKRQKGLGACTSRELCLLMSVVQATLHNCLMGLFGSGACTRACGKYHKKLLCKVSYPAFFTVEKK